MPAHVLDEIAIASSSAVSAAAIEIARIVPQSIGAIVEYELQRFRHRTDLPRLSEHSDLPMVARIEQLVAFGSGPCSTSLQPVEADAVKIPLVLRDDPTWIAFVKRAELTAREVGLGEFTAAGLAGAIGELADNVILHSDAASTGIAGFARREGVFEYFVADAGIGMLSSLRKAPEFASLRDDLEALPLAITPGISRRGRDSGSGYGYRAVFAPLREASGGVRLRSGKAVLQVSGLGPTPDQGRCSQRPDHQGVVVTVQISPQVAD